MALQKLFGQGEHFIGFTYRYRQLGQLVLQVLFELAITLTVLLDSCVIETGTVLWRVLLLDDITSVLTQSRSRMRIVS